MSANFERLQEIYQSGEVPWDHADPPPEVLAFVPTLPPGRALDLGCGLGRASIFMARLGWQVDGIDFVPQAITAAQERAASAGVSANVRFHHRAVTDLSFLTGPYTLAIDVGCGHNFNPAELHAYHAELRRLLQPGGFFLLFAHLNDESAPAETQRWLNELALVHLFGDGFVLERAEYGRTHVRDDNWRSAWFWFRRR